VTPLLMNEFPERIRYVGRTVHVQVDRIRALAGQVPDHPDQVIRVAGDPGPEKPRPGLAEGLLAPFQVAGVAADAGGHGSGHPHRRRVTAGAFADAPKIRVPLAQVQAESAIEFVSVLRGQGRGPLCARAANDDLRPGRPAGNRGTVLHLVMLALVAEPLSRPGVPDAAEYRELLFEPVEPLPQGRERDAEVLVLALVPGGPDAEFGAPPAHLVNRRHLDRQLPRKPERGGVNQGAEPDPLGLPGEPGKRGPRVSRLITQVVRIDSQVVIGPEEGIEPARFRRLGQGKDLRIGSTVMRFKENPQPHTRSFRVC
jgi:hypothetical protein